MKVIALETFSTGVISMWKGEIREISDADSDYAEFQTLLTEGKCIEEYSEGGGGSGDFTTANVTIVYNNQHGRDMYAPFVKEENEVYHIPPAIMPSEYFEQGETTCKVALYKGSCMLYTDNVPVTSVSGNAIPVGGDGEVHMVFIKGDCTITTA